MTNKLKYFIGNWKMFGDFSSFKIINEVNKYIYKSKKLGKKKIVLCVPNTLIHFYKKKLRSKLIRMVEEINNCIGNENNFLPKESILCHWCYLWEECTAKVGPNPVKRAD